MGSNPTGRTKINAMETRIKELLEEAITRVIETDKLIREKHLENTQEFLNW